MSNEKNSLVKDAIADAKQIREVAIANAKAILAEQMAPQIQSLVSKQMENMDAITEEKDEVVEESKVEESVEKVEVKPEGDKVEIEITDEDEVEGEKPVEESSDPGFENLATEKEKEFYGEAEGNSEEEVDVDAVLAELEKEEEAGGLDVQEAKECDKDKEKVDENQLKLTEARLAKATGLIKRMKEELVEANLLNGKLVHLTKLFKNYNFSKDQRERMVEVFDRSNSLNEIKLTYDILVESATSNKKTDVTKKRIAEGLASKTSKVTQEKKEVINEGQVDEYVTRLQKLAGIKSTNKKQING